MLPEKGSGGAGGALTVCWLNWKGEIRRYNGARSESLRRRQRECLRIGMVMLPGKRRNKSTHAHHDDQLLLKALETLNSKPQQ